MDGADQPGPSPRGESSRYRRHAWVGYLMLGLLFLLWAVLAAEAADQRRWVNFAGFTVLALASLVMPTGALKGLVRALASRQSR